MPLPYDKLVVGLDERSDIPHLLDLGIRHFFAGYLPEQWLTTYATQLSLNRRYRLKEQFTRLDRLESAIAAIHERGGKIDMALNAPYFNSELLPQALDTADLFIRLGVDGIVVGSLALLNALRERGYAGIVLSNLLGCYSVEAVAFFVERFQPARVVLPRDLLPQEIGHIAGRHPEVKFEVFLFGDHCRLSEAFCFVEHGYDSVVRQDLCGYAAAQRRYHRRAVPTFKRVLRDANLSPRRAEKRPYRAFRRMQYGSPRSIGSCKESLRHCGTTGIIWRKAPAKGRRLFRPTCVLA